MWTCAECGAKWGEEVGLRCMQCGVLRPGTEDRYKVVREEGVIELTAVEFVPTVIGYNAEGAEQYRYMSIGTVQVQAQYLPQEMVKALEEFLVERMKEQGLFDKLRRPGTSG